MHWIDIYSKLAWQLCLKGRNQWLQIQLVDSISWALGNQYGFWCCLIFSSSALIVRQNLCIHIFIDHTKVGNVADTEEQTFNPEAWQSPALGQQKSHETQQVEVQCSAVLINNVFSSWMKQIIYLTVLEVVAADQVNLLLSWWSYICNIKPNVLLPTSRERLVKTQEFGDESEA